MTSIPYISATNYLLMNKLILLSSFLLIFIACQNGQKQAFTDTERADILVSASQVQQIIDSNSATLIDVRTPKEIANGKISDALEIDFRSDAFKTEISKLDKNKSYVVYCKSGGRSHNAYNIMKELGFSKVKDLEGGYKAWSSYQSKN